MDFGLLSFWSSKLHESQAEGFAANFNEVQKLDELEWDSVFVGGVPLGSLGAQPFVLASAIAARTRKIRIGTAVHLPGLKATAEKFEAEVPEGGSTIERRGRNFEAYKYVFDYLASADPIHTAEQIAMVDQVSDGRFIYGAGGNTAGNLERQNQFFEFLDVVKQALVEEEFSGYEGEYYNYPPIPSEGRLMPKVAQKPHPQILLPLDSQQSFAPMGERGYHIAIGSGTTHNERGDSVLREDVKNYRQAWRDAGHPGDPTVTVRISTYVAATKAEFLRKMQAAIVERTRIAAAHGQIEKPGDASDPTPDLLGTPEEVVDRIHELREDFGVDGFLCGMHLGLPRQEQLECIQLFAEKVMPEFK